MLGVAIGSRGFCSALPARSRSRVQYDARARTMKIQSALVGLAVGGGVAVAATMLLPSAAQSAVNYFDETKVVSASNSSSATCPAGWKVTGGGFRLPSDSFGGGSSREYKVTSSAPSGNSWKVTATVINGSYSSTKGWSYYTSSASPSTYAVCTR